MKALRAALPAVLPGAPSQARLEDDTVHLSLGATALSLTYAEPERYPAGGALLLSEEGRLGALAERLQDRAPLPLVVAKVRHARARACAGGRGEGVRVVTQGMQQGVPPLRVSPTGPAPVSLHTRRPCGMRSPSAPLVQLRHSAARAATCCKQQQQPQQQRCACKH